MKGFFRIALAALLAAVLVKLAVFLRSMHRLARITRCL